VTKPNDQWQVDRASMVGAASAQLPSAFSGGAKRPPNDTDRAAKKNEITLARPSMIDSLHLRSGGDRIRVTDFVFKKSDSFQKTVDDTNKSPRFLTPLKSELAQVRVFFMRFALNSKLVKLRFAEW
jgi:hypothetical protein